jgi:hypothetical protein
MDKAIDKTSLKQVLCLILTIILDFRRTNAFSSMKPNSIDDVFGTIANGQLCVLV